MTEAPNTVAPAAAGAAAVDAVTTAAPYGAVTGHRPPRRSAASYPAGHTQNRRRYVLIFTVFLGCFMRHGALCARRIFRCGALMPFRDGILGTIYICIIGRSTV